MDETTPEAMLLSPEDLSSRLWRLQHRPQSRHSAHGDVGRIWPARVSEQCAELEMWSYQHGQVEEEPRGSSFILFREVTCSFSSCVFSRLTVSLAVIHFCK